ncbi:MAG: hypothetical protein DRJ03_27180, partial [Chloroflexi bacterium]
MPRGLYFNQRQEHFVLFRGGSIPEKEIERIFTHNISFYNASHDFGEVPLGSSSSEVEFVMINTSLLTARVFPELKGHTHDFEILNEIPVIVPWNQTAAIRVRFHPTKVGKREAW